MTVRKYGSRLAGKVAIVTGAASRAPGTGTGSAIARLFARQGATVMLVNRSADHAQELRDEIALEGGDARVCAADVTRSSDVDELARKVYGTLGRIDVLVNNVGGSARGSVVTVDHAVWESVFALNVTSAMLCSKYCIPFMIESGGGSIINVSSVIGATARMRIDGRVAYATAKAALVGLTHSIVADYSHHGVRANCLLVGMINTPFVSHYGDDRKRERRRISSPLRIEGTAWDVGHAAVFLASEEARFINGVMLPIDGGEMLFRDDTTL